MDQHLLLITPGFAADEQDSRCIPPLQAYVRQLQEQGKYRISVLALHYPFERKVYNWHGVQVHACGQSRFFKKLNCWWAARRYMSRLHQAQAINGIHSFWLSDGALLGHRFARQQQIPHWLTFMGQDVRQDNFYLKLLPPDHLYTITLSPFQDEVLHQSTGHRANRIIPWGLDRLSLPPLDQAREIDVLGVGNLIPLKNYHLFLRVLAQVKKTYPGLKAVLIGDGVARSSLEREAQALGLSEVVTFKAYLPRAAVIQYMCRSKVFLHTSTFESFGYVFPEALACGMQVVSTPVGIAQGNAYWAVADTEVGLVEGVGQALELGARKEAIRPWEMEGTVRDYLEVYGEGLG
ncbi:MAG: glycosyltransferase [Bacteroidota bacterium]